MAILSRFAWSKRCKVCRSPPAFAPARHARGVLGRFEVATRAAVDEARPAVHVSSPAAVEARPELPPVWKRLDDQIDWYDRGSRRSKRWYLRLKVVQIVTAASIPVLATAWPEKAWIGGGLGALIVVLEGLQQLFQHHSNWTQYRSTCEALRHEKYLWMAHAGPYARSQRPDALLAERIEGLVSQEQAKWASTQSEKTSHSQ
jgi:hypothetical protein